MKLIMRTMFACLIFSLIPAPARGQETLTPHQATKIHNVGDAAIAPDGKLIAYTLVVPRTPLAYEDGVAWTELHVAATGREA